MKLCTCTKCGWVHMAVTREYAERESSKFRDWWEQQDEEVQGYYSKPEEGIFNLYKSCWCGSKSFRDYKQGDCPEGVTIGPVICELEEE